MFFRPPFINGRPQDSVSVFGKALVPFFESLVPVFFICFFIGIIFKKESPGGDRGRPGETGGDQDLQLVPGRDNIGDVGL